MTRRVDVTFVKREKLSPVGWLLYRAESELASAGLRLAASRTRVREVISRWRRLFASADGERRRLTVREVPLEWADGSPLEDGDRMHIALLRVAGCHCELPLLGFRMLNGVRCRVCATDVIFECEGGAEVD